MACTKCNIKTADLAIKFKIHYNTLGAKKSISDTNYHRFEDKPN